MKKLYFLLLTILSVSLSFGQVFITEIADPNNNAEARYIELYNAGATPVDFTEGNGWQIDKYLNAATGVNATLDLTGSIPAGGFYIIAYDNTPGTFQSVYGFAPDQLDAVNNGVVGSNGDDDLALVNGSDVIVDFFGVYDFGALPNDPSDDINTDNTTTCAEYEDGRAERLTSVTTGSSTFNEAEWNIWADSAASDTCTNFVVLVRDAPSDFDPGAWGSPTCGLSLSNSSATCDAVTSGTDTYTVTLDFSGGGTATYSVMADSGSVDLSGGNPTIDATGTITVTGVLEGTDVTITITGDGGLCDLMNTLTSPTCEPMAALPLYENFEYGGSSGDLTAVSGGNWVNHSGTGAVVYGTTNLSMSGYPSSGLGGSVVVSGSLGEDVNRSFQEQTSGTIYMSALVNLSSVTTTGNYFLHLKDDGTGFRARIGAKDDGSGNVLFGIGSSSTIIYGTTLFSLNTTYLVVAAYNIDTDASKLYVLTSPVASEPVTPEANDPGTSAISISSIALRQASNIPTATVDGINVSKTWYNLLSSRDFFSNNFKIYPNPTSTGVVNIVSNNTSPMEVRVFDILGKQVRIETITSTLNVSGLKSGIYILNITQEGHTVTKKLVIE